jgi:hypothetical protein
MELLFDFFRKYINVKEDKIQVIKDSILSMLDYSSLERVVGSVTHNQFSAVYRQTSRECSIAKLMMRGPQHANPNWIHLRYDRNLYGFKAFHIELHWKVCDSWLVDDFVSLMYRRCSKWSLRLCQTPEYFATSNLSVHPFKALPYIQLPDYQYKVPIQHSSPMRLLERCLFGRSQGWLFDSEQATEWSKIGIAPPAYADRDRDLVQLESESQLLAANTNANTTSALFWPFSFKRMGVFKKSDDQVEVRSDVFSSTAIESSGISTTLLNMRPSNIKLDRQYVHVSGMAVVRMAGNGFIYMQNANGRTSETAAPINGPNSIPADYLVKSYSIPEGTPMKSLLSLSDVSASTSGEDKKTETVKMMQKLETYFALVVDCFEIILWSIEEAIKISDANPGGSLQLFQDPIIVPFVEERCSTPIGRSRSFDFTLATSDGDGKALKSPEKEPIMASTALPSSHI